MSTIQSAMRISGGVLTKKIVAEKVPLSWKVKNLPNVWPGICQRKISRAFGIPTYIGELGVKVLRSDGQYVDYGTVSNKAVTDGFVYNLVNWMQASPTIGLAACFHWHGSGSGAGAEGASQTGLVSEASLARVDGTQTESASNAYQTVATRSYTGAFGIVEHGIFSASETTGSLLDRSLFASIGVGTGDSIQFTYTLTISSSG